MKPTTPNAIARERSCSILVSGVKLLTALSIAVSLLAVTVGPSHAISSSQIRTGSDAATTGLTLIYQEALYPCHFKVPYRAKEILHRNDDESSVAISLPVEMSPLNFLGEQVEELWVNNNGNITFDGPLQEYTPFALLDTDRAIIAPYFADVDTRPSNSGEVSYGVTEFDGQLAFCVTWDHVGYYDSHTDKRATFQLILVSRQNLGDGFFDIIFNYGSIQWESGDESDGSNGFGGTVARLGYANGSRAAQSAFEFAAAGQTRALVDGGRSELRSARRNSNIPGRLIFEIRDGEEQRTGGGNGDDKLVYAALGDSYSSGVGTEQNRTDTSSDPCYRNGYSYGALLFQRTDDSASFINATCGGAVTEDIVTRGQFRNYPHELATSPDIAQVKHLDGTVDLITLTIGGNDIGFSAILTYCLAVSLCNEKFRDAVGGRYDPNSRNIESLYGTLFDTYQQILANAPNASIFVLGYPTIVSNHSEHQWGCFTYRALEKDEVDYIQGLSQLLNETIAVAAAAAGVHFVDIASSDAGSQRRGVCSPLESGQYINDIAARDFSNKDNFFHPNRAGHEAYLDVLLDLEPLDLPPNPTALLRRGESPPPARTFKIGFVLEYGGWRIDDTTDTRRPAEDELVADFGAEGLECRYYSTFVASCRVGLQVRETDGEKWRATIYSEPIVVGSGPVGSDGTFEISFDDLLIPTGLHTLIVEIEGPATTEILVHQFVVDAAELRNPAKSDEATGSVLDVGEDAGIAGSAHDDEALTTNDPPAAEDAAVSDEATGSVLDVGEDAGIAGSAHDDEALATNDPPAAEDAAVGGGGVDQAGGGDDQDDSATARWIIVVILAAAVLITAAITALTIGIRRRRQ